MITLRQNNAKTIINYLDVRAAYGGNQTLDFLRSKRYSHTLVVDSKDVAYLLKHLNKKDNPGKIDPDRLRLYVPDVGGSGDYVMDQEGRVRHRGEKYVISPLSFLFLSDYLDNLKAKNGITEGLPPCRHKK